MDKEKFGAKVHKYGSVVPKVKTKGRSELFVEKNCCSSKIPVIELILKLFPGVHDAKINPTTKAVYIIHNYKITLAIDIVKALNKEALGAMIHKDAGAISSNEKVRSAVFVESTLLLSSSIDSKFLLEMVRNGQKWSEMVRNGQKSLLEILEGKSQKL